MDPSDQELCFRHLGAISEINVGMAIANSDCIVAPCEEVNSFFFTFVLVKRADAIEAFALHELVSKARNCSSLMILTPYSFAFLNLEDVPSTEFFVQSALVSRWVV